MRSEDQVVVCDTRGRSWVGEHAFALIDLRPLFGILVDVDFGSSLLLDVLRERMPPHVHVLRALGPKSVHLHVVGGRVSDIVVKACRPGAVGGLRRLTAPLRRSRARRAFDWGHRLRALGIDTPRPLGYVEQKDSPALGASFCVTEFVRAPTLTEVRDDLASKSPRPAEAAAYEKRALVLRLADFVRTLHDHRIFHGDLHAANLLVATNGIYLLDLESIRQAPVGPGPRLRNLERLNRDFSEFGLLSRLDCMRFLDRYLMHRPRDERRRQRAMLFERIERTRLKKAKQRKESLA